MQITYAIRFLYKSDQEFSGVRENIDLATLSSAMHHALETSPRYCVIHRTIDGEAFDYQTMHYWSDTNADDIDERIASLREDERLLNLPIDRRFKAGCFYMTPAELRAARMDVEVDEHVRSTQKPIL
ncbi:MULTISPECIES: hypothetical protein [Ralstonia solanacearum species complex]|uniref:hypothetical protein n=1 Tax=Ralstonia solanacearum species complex TaxID=3116862 RepID=UPI0018D0EE38|nr:MULTISPECIES: hypothetical protein [Ralstonia solanacearum species complex]MDN3368278.1 hypothetical protein [Ralstonia pseudosolanacearum]